MKNPIKKEWSKKDSYWYEQRITTNTGVRVLYHFRRKSAEPIPEVIFDTKISKQLSGYKLIEKDLNDTYELIEEHNKFFNNCDNPAKNIVIKGLMKAIVITYGKCFSQADGRKIKLDKKNIPNEGLKTHEYIIKLRNEYIAHGGNSMNETAKVQLLTPPCKEVTKMLNGKSVKGSVMLIVPLFQLSTTSEIFLNSNFMEVLKRLIKFVQEKIERLTNLLRIDLIDPQIICNLTKNKKKLILTDEFLEKILAKPKNT